MFLISKRSRRSLFTGLLITASLIFSGNAVADKALSAKDLLSLKSVSEIKISPDGKKIAYTVYVPRKSSDIAGSAYRELYVYSLEDQQSTPFVTGSVSIKSISWKPDGSAIGFVTKRGNDKKSQLWTINLAGGEARRITDSETGISGYKWHPTENKLAYIAAEPKTAKEKYLKEHGYGFIYYEENLKHKNLYMLDLDSGASVQLTSGVSIWSMQFAPDGQSLAVALSEKNLIDHKYMFSKINILNLSDKNLQPLSENGGKLGNYAFSPDGKNLVYAAALERKDHAVSQVFLVPVSGGKARNLTKSNFKGHVNWVGWKDNDEIVYRAAEGVEVSLNVVNIKSLEQKTILDSRKNGGIIFGTPVYTKNFKRFAFTGQTPQFPAELYYWRNGKKVQRLSNLNPWLSNRSLGNQETIRFNARDGLEIEGLLIYPVGYQKGQKYPTVVLVHGGPESNHSNGWLSRYSTPGQVLAGKGYVVYYPNYRASTGYGVEFAAQGYNDAAGKEFDDLADGIEHLVGQGIADPERVGLGGGSYGGFASAWFATYYTKYVKAVCMFVGISDLISKRGTTDIPYEELYVHSGKKLEDMWQQSLERSPIYYAHQSKTATLIFGGAADPRVHPSQSLELYRRMKMNDHPAVRLVQYPGEGHGNAKQPGRIDVLYRIIDWYDWYVKDSKALDGPMPALDISSKYGLDLPE